MERKVSDQVDSFLRVKLKAIENVTFLVATTLTEFKQPFLHLYCSRAVENSSYKQSLLVRKYISVLKKILAHIIWRISRAKWKMKIDGKLRTFLINQVLFIGLNHFSTSSHRTQLGGTMVKFEVFKTTTTKPREHKPH